MDRERDRAFVAEHLKDDLSKVALKIHGSSELDVPWVLQQIAGYQAVEKKLPDWYRNPDIVFPVSLSLEQCSSEATALYKKHIVEKYASGGREVGKTVASPTEYTTINKKEIKNLRIGADLTGGFGVDAWAISELFESYHYVERNTELCQIAKENFKVLDRSHIEVHNADAQAYLETMPPVDFIFMDPARRDSKGGKVVQLSDCEPDVTQLLDTLRTKTRFLLLKLSPMLDISLALKALPNVQEIHVVAVDNDCKELLFLVDFQDESLQATAIPSPINIEHRFTCKIHTINILGSTKEQRFVFSQAQEESADCPMADRLCRYLYEPNVAVLKGGAFRQTGAEFHLGKLHANTHIYTSDHLEESFPGKIFEVEQVLKPSGKETKTLLQQVAQANISVRNYPESVDTLRKRFHIKDGGDKYLYGLTLHPNEHVLVLCHRIAISRSHRDVRQQ